MSQQTNEARIQSALEQIADAPYGNAYVFDVTPQYLRTSKIPDEYLCQLILKAGVKTDGARKEFHIIHLAHKSKRADPEYRVPVIYVRRNGHNTNTSIDDLNAFSAYLADMVNGEMVINENDGRPSNSNAANSIYPQGELTHKRFAELLEQYRHKFQRVFDVEVTYLDIPRNVFDANKGSRKGFGSLDESCLDAESQAINKFLSDSKLMVAIDASGHVQFRNLNGCYVSSRGTMNNLLALPVPGS